MILSRNWLHAEFVDLSAVSDAEYAETMTRFGLRVASWQRVEDDTLVEFEIPAGRPDLGSVIGLARESAAAFGMKRKNHEPQVRETDAGSIYEYLDAEVYAEDLCSRYTARMVTGLRIAPSPAWMRQRLLACGVRPVNNIVDIARYVTLEYGQPIRLRDPGQITSGMIVVREALEGETFTGASGEEFVLESGTAVIADGFRPIGLADTDHPITDGIDAVVFEAACYDAAATDPLLTVPALQRVCELVQLLEAGTVLDGSLDVLCYVPMPRQLPLDAQQFNALLDAPVSEERMIECLNLLEIQVEDGQILIPSFRPDLETIEDIAAEIRRCVKN